MTPDSAGAKTVAPFRAKTPPAVATPPVRDDATLEFASENTPAEARPDASAASLPVVIKIKKPAMLALAAGILALVGGAGAWAVMTFPLAAVPTGSLNIESDPPGAEVRIDDAVRGTTPLTLTLPEGNHTLTVQRGPNVKRTNIEIVKGGAKAYHVAWAETAVAAAPLTGSLSIVSDPAGSTVTVDGTARGQTPLTIRDLSPGRHEVLVRGANTTYQRSVQVEAGATASLLVGGAPAATASWGWINLQTPFTVQVYEAGRMVGTNQIDRIMLSPGNHQLDFVSDQFGFRQSLQVSVSAGRGAPVSLTIPRVPVNINALPWAEVFIDGTRIGDTPLANVMQPLGEHEIVFRHPQLGEKRQVAQVKSRDSLRVSVDMRSR